MNLVLTSLLIVCAVTALYGLELSVLSAPVKLFPAAVKACSRVSPTVRHAAMGAVLGIAGLLAALFGTITVSGLPIHCALVALICAGLLFGPAAGIASGLVIGAGSFAHQSVWTIPPLCLACCLAIGVLAGFIKRKIIGDEETPFSIAFAVTSVSIGICLWMFLLPQNGNFPRALAILSSSSDSLLICNVVTLIVCFYVARAVRRVSSGMRLSQALSLHSNPSSQTVLMSFRRRVSCVAFIAMFLCSMASILVMHTASFLGETGDHQTLLDSIESIAADAAEAEQTDPVRSVVALANSWSDNAGDIIDNESNGFAFIVLDEQGNILTKEKKYDRTIIENLNGEPRFLIYVDIYTDNDFANMPDPLLAMYDDCQDYRLVAYSQRSQQNLIDNFLYLFLFTVQNLIFLLLICAINLYFRRMVSDNLKTISDSLTAAMTGALNEELDVGHHREFDELSGKINEAVQSFKKATEKRAKFENDIELARQIQLSALPQDFPAFPDQTEFDLFASYRSAEEVGGDFYDYFFIDQKHLVFLIADVSGKGIPAALFMMRAKMALQTFSRTHTAPNDILYATNNYLCTDNTASMFVTCWLGILDITTGKLQYASAGHDAPIIIREKGHGRAIPNANGIMLGFVEDSPYACKTIDLQAGTMLFLYTDGVTEAHNTEGALFGKSRLLGICKSHASMSEDPAACSSRSKSLCADIAQAIDVFADGARQFDDITMLAIEFFGDYFSYEQLDDHEIPLGDFCAYRLSFSASTPNIAKLIDQANAILEENRVPQKVMYQFDMIADELLSNIVRHGQLGSTDRIEVNLAFGTDSRASSQSQSSRKQMLRMTISDPGIPFNPLTHDSPNTSPSLDDAHAGGVGIHLVKRAADFLSYSRTEDKNVLTVGMRFLPSRH